MNRLEWINEILLPWKPGDIRQFKYKYKDEGRWKDCAEDKEDPVSGDPDLPACDYRIKPRTVKWVIECESKTDPNTFKRVAQALDATDNWTACFIEAIHNAKKLDEN